MQSTKGMDITVDTADIEARQNVNLTGEILSAGCFIRNPFWSKLIIENSEFLSVFITLGSEHNYHLIVLVQGTAVHCAALLVHATPVHSVALLVQDTAAHCAALLVHDTPVHSVVLLLCRCEVFSLSRCCCADVKCFVCHAVSVTVWSV